MSALFLSEIVAQKQSYFNSWHFYSHGAKSHSSLLLESDIFCTSNNQLICPPEEPRVAKMSMLIIYIIIVSFWSSSNRKTWQKIAHKTGKWSHVWKIWIFLPDRVGFRQHFAGDFELFELPQGPETSPQHRTQETPTKCGLWVSIFAMWKSG